MFDFSVGKRKMSYRSKSGAMRLSLENTVDVLLYSKITEAPLCASVVMQKMHAFQASRETNFIEVLSQHVCNTWVCLNGL
jgi:hypothetical protein